MKNKVPKKVGYVANEYTGKSVMYDKKRKKAMGGMYNKMNRGGYMKGGKMGHKSISDMERACSAKVGMNTMSEKRG
jgi:hypothetical protein